MEEHAKMALAFTVDCMNWESPFLVYIGDVGDVVKESKLSLSPYFAFSDITDVLYEVRQWCKLNKLWWKIGDSDYPYEDGVYVAIGTRRDGGEELSEEYADDLCFALLSACVKAAAKLKKGKIPYDE